MDESVSEFWNFYQFDSKIAKIQQERKGNAARMV